MEKVIVTGGAGFIGSHIVDALILEGHEVHVIDNLCAGKKENVNPKAILHILDIRDKETMAPIFDGVKYVFHLAALPVVQYSIENPIETNEVNVGGLLNILELSRLNGVKRLIFASSCAVYGEQVIIPFVEDKPVFPISPYATQKYIGEIYLKLYSQIYHLETVSLRYFNVYGNRQSTNGAYPLVIARFLELKKENKPLLITGDGENTRDYVNVKDVVHANILAMKNTKVGSGEVINIGTGIQYSVNSIAKLIGGEISYIRARVELKNAEADIKKAKELLDWSPEVALEDAILELKK